MARRTPSSRGWLKRASRSSACFSAATSGSAVPVIADCWTATRTPASMSTSTFSSRDRESDWIRSSSWPRCSDTSATRASSSAILAALSRMPSCACLASMCASAACAWLSC